MTIFDKARSLEIDTGYVDTEGQWREARPEVLEAVVAEIAGGIEAQGWPKPDASSAFSDKAFAGEFDRCWVLAVQLYSLRSQSNWGIGDFSDLHRLIKMSAEIGAAGIGVNPLHALFDDRPDECSPYAPSSRLFLNSLYIDVAAVPEFPKAFLAQHQDMIAALRDTKLVNYAHVAELKNRALTSAWEGFCERASDARHHAFDAFRQERGKTLLRFAAFEVLRRLHRGPWWEWPEPWRCPDDSDIALMQKGPHRAAMDQVAFAQFCAHEQLQNCRRVAMDKGLAVGLYLDLAVGVRPDGFDAWNEQAVILRRLSVGAPPDHFNTAGQNWGLAGFSATGLARTSFKPFREMLRAAMRYAGAVRIDHAMGLERLYLIPHGFQSDEGAYVHMPFDALGAVCAEESLGHRCVVIGEDLGTVPEGFREAMLRVGLWSCRVMMFERDHQGMFLDAASYPPDALLSFSTHDLATFSGWCDGRDLVVKHSLGIDPGETVAERRLAVAQLQERLRKNDISEDSFAGAVAFLASTSPRLLAVMIEDVLGVVDQPNVPGTIDEYPNWRRKLPVPIEALASCGEVAALLPVLKQRSCGLA